MAASIFIPACINRLDGQNIEFENFENVIEALASGIYLGLLMLFMIPETIDDFVDVWGSKIKERLTIHTMALSSLCLGLFLVAIVEYIAAKATCCIEGSPRVSPSVSVEGTEGNGNNDEANSPLNPIEGQTTDHAEDPVENPRRNDSNDCQDCKKTKELKKQDEQKKIENEVWSILSNLVIFILLTTEFS